MLPKRQVGQIQYKHYSVNNYIDNGKNENFTVNSKSYIWFR